jgi:hypothetical protein
MSNVVLFVGQRLRGCTGLNPKRVPSSYARAYVIRQTLRTSLPRCFPPQQTSNISPFMASQTGWIYSQEHGRYYYSHFANGQWNSVWHGDGTVESALPGRIDLHGAVVSGSRQKPQADRGEGHIITSQSLHNAALDPSTDSYWLSNMILTTMAGYYVRTGQEASAFFQPGRVCMSSVIRRIVLNYFG